MFTAIVAPSPEAESFELSLFPVFAASDAGQIDVLKLLSIHRQLITRPCAVAPIGSAFLLEVLQQNGFASFLLFIRVSRHLPSRSP